MPLLKMIFKGDFIVLPQAKHTWWPSLSKHMSWLKTQISISESPRGLGPEKVQVATSGFNRSTTYFNKMFQWFDKMVDEMPNKMVDKMVSNNSTNIFDKSGPLFYVLKAAFLNGNKIFCRKSRSAWGFLDRFYSLLLGIWLRHFVETFRFDKISFWGGPG